LSVVRRSEILRFLSCCSHSFIQEARRKAKLEEQQEQQEQEHQEEEDAWWEEDELYCPVCDKRFRSKGAYGDHERGKKHLDGVLRLIEEEGLDVDDLLSAGLRLESDGDDDDDETVEAAEETAEETAEEKGGSTEGSTKEKKKKKEKKEKKKRRASKGSKESSKESSRETTCGGCGEGFGSRTKLFAHLRAFPGHATLRR
jgi:hypothetical protein